LQTPACSSNCHSLCCSRGGGIPKGGKRERGEKKQTTSGEQGSVVGTYDRRARIRFWAGVSGRKKKRGFPERGEANLVCITRKEYRPLGTSPTEVGAKTQKEKEMVTTPGKGGDCGLKKNWKKGGEILSGLALSWMN